MSIIFFRCNQSLRFMVRAVLTCKATADGGNVKCRHGLSVGGLDGSLPQIFSSLQNLGIPSALSDLTLALFPLNVRSDGSTKDSARREHSQACLSFAEPQPILSKNGSPDHEARKDFTKGKRIKIKTFKNKELCE